MRYEKEYILIVRDGDDAREWGRLGLRRLSPHLEIPEGYLEVLSLNGLQVYDENGRLLPELRGITRMKSRSEK